MSNFGRRHHKEQFCEIILSLDKCFSRRCRLKIFLIWSSGGPFVQWSRTICAIFKEGIIGNIHVKLYEIWSSGLRDVVLRYFLSGAHVALLFSRAEPFMQFW